MAFSNAHIRGVLIDVGSTTSGTSDQVSSGSSDGGYTGGTWGAPPSGYQYPNDPNTGATNSTGFNAIPAGSFSYCGMYPPTYCQSNKGYLGQFWTYSGDTAWYRGLDWNRSDVQHQTKDKWAGKSVRCVQD